MPNEEELVRTTQENPTGPTLEGESVEEILAEAPLVNPAEVEEFMRMAREDAQRRAQLAMESMADTLSVSAGAVAEPKPPEILTPVDLPTLKPQADQDYTKPLHTAESIKEMVEKKCPQPNCRKFVEVVLIANDNHLPGLYCVCGWNAPLPAILAKPDQALHLMSPTLVKLIRYAPLNPMVRSQIHSFTLSPVPKSCRTYDTIMTWVSAVVAIGKKINPYIPAPSEQRVAVEVPVSYSYVDYGTARYRVTMEGSDDYIVTEQDMNHMVEEAIALGWDFERLLREVRQTLIDDASENNPSTEPGEYSYDSHESTDTDEDDLSLDANLLKDQLREWLRRTRREDLEILETR